MKSFILLSVTTLSSFLFASSPMRRAEFMVDGYLVDLYANTKSLAFHLDGKSIINLDNPNDCILLVNQKPHRCAWASYLSPSGPRVYTVDFYWQDFLGWVRNEAQLESSAAALVEVLERFFATSTSRTVTIIVGNNALSPYSESRYQSYRPASGGEYEGVLESRGKQTNEIP